MSDTETIVAELKLPVSVDTLAAIADALGSVHGKGNLFIRPSGAVFRIFKRGAKEGEVVTDGFSKTLIKLQDLLARADQKLDATAKSLDTCGFVARGGKIKPEDHSYSKALDDVMTLRRDYENLLAAVQ